MTNLNPLTLLNLDNGQPVIILVPPRTSIATGDRYKPKSVSVMKPQQQELLVISVNPRLLIAGVLRGDQRARPLIDNFIKKFPDHGFQARHNDLKHKNFLFVLQNSPVHRTAN